MYGLTRCGELLRYIGICWLKLAHRSVNANTHGRADLMHVRSAHGSNPAGHVRTLQHRPGNAVRLFDLPSNARFSSTDTHAVHCVLLSSLVLSFSSSEVQRGACGLQPCGGRPAYMWAATETSCALVNVLSCSARLPLSKLFLLVPSRLGLVDAAQASPIHR